MKKPRHRIFEYIPRFYKPELDEHERRKRRLGFSRHRRYGSRKKSYATWFVLAILAFYIYLKLKGFI